MPKYTLPQLSYSYSSLEPYIDAQTMELHHSKHHQTYVNNLNATLEKHAELQEKTLESLLTDPNLIPTDIRQAVINSGGGHFNHTFFWNILAPVQSAPVGPSEQLLGMLAETFGSFDDFKKLFTQTALSHFGSGWAWLALNPLGAPEVFSTPNQETPLSRGKTPLLTLDVWEHAYYLKYQNKRAEYIDAFWHVVNWKLVESLLRFGEK